LTTNKVFLVLLFSVSLGCSAQDFFNYRYNVSAWTNPEGTFLFQTADSELACLTLKIDTLNYFSNILSKFNEDGIPIWAKNIHVNPGIQLDQRGSLYRIDDSKMLLMTTEGVYDTTYFVYLDSAANPSGFKKIFSFRSLLSAFEPADTSIYLLGSDSNPVFTIVKIDMNGNPLWSRKITGPGPVGWSRIKPDYDGGLLVSMLLDVPGFPLPNYHIGLLKLSASGDVLWEREISSQDTSIHTMYAADVTGAPSGNYVVCSHMQQDTVWKLLLILCDSSGRPIANNVIEAGRVITAHFLEKESNDFVIYCTLSIYGNSHFDAILRIDSALNFISLTSYSDTLHKNTLTGFCKTMSGSTVISGTNFDSGAYQLSLMNIDSLDSSCAVKNYFNSASSFVNLIDTSVAFSSVPVSLSADTNAFPISFITIPSVPAGQCMTFTNVDAASGSNSLILTPNPATSSLMLQAGNSALLNEKYVIRDLCGRELMSGMIFHDHPEIDVSSLRTGFYFIEIQAHEGSVAKKFLKD